MPRAIWSGTVSFGLVSVPVKMYSAIEEADLHFHLIHEPDNGRIGYQKICKTEEEPVPEDEIVKAFEVGKGEHVVLSDEDFEAAKSEGVKSIEITDFVPYEEIDPIYFERTYYLGPQDGGEKVYSLLRAAMEKTELAAIGKYVMRERQHLGCLRVRDGTITLERLYFHDEVRPVKGIAPRRSSVPKAELELATTLIERISGAWDPKRYEDTYREALLKIVRAKRKGKTISAPEPEEQERVPDLLEALQASVQAAQGRRRRSGRAKRPAGGKPSRKPAGRKRQAKR